MTVATAAPPIHGPSWRAGVWLAAAFAAAASMYAEAVLGLASQWFDNPNAAYGFFVAIAAAVATTQRWSRVRALRPEGSAWGAGALVAAAGLYIIGTLAADLFLIRISLVAFVAAALWFVCGREYLRALAVPLVLCLVAIPLPTAVVTELTLPLQLAASRCAAALLGFAGVDVVRDGNVLTMSYITLEVAEACSGMRSLITLLALVAVYWGTFGAATSRVLYLVAAAVPVALAGNSLRVAFTALLASRIGEDATRGLVHDATGFGAFVIMCALLAGVHVVVSRVHPAEAAT